jgi:hypothetical protein
MYHDAQLDHEVFGPDWSWMVIFLSLPLRAVILKLPVQCIVQNYFNKPLIDICVIDG